MLPRQTQSTRYGPVGSLGGGNGGDGGSGRGVAADSGGMPLSMPQLYWRLRRRFSLRTRPPPMMSRWISLVPS
jgi:hypothetical protein